jgi:hypothetical protein
MKVMISTNGFQALAGVFAKKSAGDNLLDNQVAFDNRENVDRDPEGLNIILPK